MASFEIEAMVRGYHIYKDVWSAVIDESVRARRWQPFRSLRWLFVMAT